MRSGGLRACRYEVLQTVRTHEHRKLEHGAQILLLRQLRIYITTNSSFVKRLSLCLSLSLSLVTACAYLQTTPLAFFKLRQFRCDITDSGIMLMTVTTESASISPESTVGTCTCNRQPNAIFTNTLLITLSNIRQPRTRYVADLGDKLFPILEIYVVTYIDVGVFVNDPVVCCLEGFCAYVHLSCDWK